jgi:hypothetical protein
MEFLQQVLWFSWKGKAWLDPAGVPFGQEL